MYTVGRLARRFGLSRSTLLYYDRIGLLRPSGHVPGEYRRYGEADVRRLEQIMTYRRAGLSLGDIAEVLESGKGRVARALEDRLEELSGEIRALREQQRLVLRLLGSGRLPQDADLEHGGALDKQTWVELLRAAGFSEADMRAWHREFERRSPEQHGRFLQMLCIPRDEIEMIRAYAAAPQRIKNIKEASESYMKYLYELFEGLHRLGPGSPENTARALRAVPGLPERPLVLDVGCGTGAQTLDLARLLPDARITAVDTHQPYLDQLAERAQDAGCAGRVRTALADMRRLDADLELEPGSLDLLWSEGALYIMGIGEALTRIRAHLRPGGCLCLSECVWTARHALNDADEEVRAFWEEGYPGMMTPPELLELARGKGWEVLDSFLIGERCWHDFYDPLEERARAFLEIHPDQPDALMVAESTLREIDLFRRHPNVWDYCFLVLRKNGE